MLVTKLVSHIISWVMVSKNLKCNLFRQFIPNLVFRCQFTLVVQIIISLPLNVVRHIFLINAPFRCLFTLYRKILRS